MTCRFKKKWNATPEWQWSQLPSRVQFDGKQFYWKGSLRKSHDSFWLCHDFNNFEFIILRYDVYISYRELGVVVFFIAFVAVDVLTLYHLPLQANPPKKCTKNPMLFLASMRETGLSHDIFLKFSLGPFEVIEFKWRFTLNFNRIFLLLIK